jgi:hypothetical protein
MSKGQKRSGREPKKSKRTKQKTAVSKTTAVPTQTKPDASARGKNKW